MNDSDLMYPPLPKLSKRRERPQFDVETGEPLGVSAPVQRPINNELIARESAIEQENY